MRINFGILKAKSSIPGFGLTMGYTVFYLSIIVIILITIFVLDLSTAKKIIGFLLCFSVLTTNIIITHSQKRKKV